MFRQLLMLAAISALKPSAEPVRVTRESDNMGFPGYTKAHGLFNKSSSINKQDPSVLKFTCPNSKDVENQLNKNWVHLPPDKCDTFPSSTVDTDYPLRSPLERLYGAIRLTSCNPYIQLGNEVELNVINQTCNYGFGLIVNTSFVGCSYKITNSTADPYPDDFEIGCDPLHPTPWKPKPGYFMLAAELRNSSTCSVEGEGDHFSCLRNIPRDPMSGTWQPVNDLYPYFNYDNQANTVNYTYSLKGDDGRCCVVQFSGFGALVSQSPDGQLSFMFNPNGLNITSNKTESCSSEVFNNTASSCIEADTLLKLLDNNTIQVSYDGFGSGIVCNASTTLTRVDTEETESTPPSVRPRF